MTRPYGKVRVVGILGAEPSNRVVVHANLLVEDEAGTQFQFGTRYMVQDLKPYSPKQEISFFDWQQSLSMKLGYTVFSTLDSDWIDSAYRDGMSVSEIYALCTAWDTAVYHDKFIYRRPKK